MTAKELRVNVRETSSITAEDGDVTDLTSLSPGCLRETAAGLVLTYTQDSESGKIFNRVETTDHGLRITRSGAVELTLVLEPKRTEKTIYRVPPFSFDMLVTAEAVKIRREESGGLRIGLSFRSVVGGSAQTTRLVIRATPREEAV